MTTMFARETYLSYTRVGMRNLGATDLCGLITAALNQRDDWTKTQLQDIAFVAASLAEDLDRAEEKDIDNGHPV